MLEKVTSLYEITQKRHDSQQRITHLRGPSMPLSTTAEIMKHIDNGDHFYVNVNGQRVGIIIASLQPEYLKTTRAEFMLSILNALPDC